MTPNPIIPSLWFHTEWGDLGSVIEYYRAIFAEHFHADPIMDLGDTPGGHTQMAFVRIFGQRYSLMATATLHHEFNDAFALTIECMDQDEIDRYWNYFTREGKEVQCGWCQDQFGLRWQVIPANLWELMQKPGAWEVMMGQKKIIIAEY